MPKTGQSKQDIIIISDTAPVCLLSVYETSLHVTRSPRTSPSTFAYCKEWREEWHGNGLEMRLGQPLQELNVQYTFRVVFLAVGTDLQ